MEFAARAAPSKKLKLPFFQGGFWQISPFRTYRTWIDHERLAYVTTKERVSAYQAATSGVSASNDG